MRFLETNRACCFEGIGYVLGRARGVGEHLERVIQDLEKVIQDLEKVIQDFEGVIRELEGATERQNRRGI